jgi:hypothetical protein
LLIKKDILFYILIESVVKNMQEAHLVSTETLTIRILMDHRRVWIFNA